MSGEFVLESGALAVGDPVMGLAQIVLAAQPAGLYRLSAGALVPVGVDDGCPVIDVDTMCVYALDAKYIERFEEVFHGLGGSCSYNMMEMENRHGELEEAVGTRIGFYWAGDLSGKTAKANTNWIPPRLSPSPRCLCSSL